MAQTLTNMSQTKVTCQLDTYNYSVLADGSHTVAVRVTELPPSGLIVEIKQNGVSKALSTTPASSQSVVNLKVLLNCAINDTLTIILSSPNAADAGPNIIKAILRISSTLN
jgi:hypothetical protein